MTFPRSPLFKPARDSKRSTLDRPSEFSFQKAVEEASLPTPGGFKGTDTVGLPQVARDINELQGQIAALISAFHSAEHRLPEPDDEEFWTAYRTLVERYSESYRPHRSGVGHD